MKIGLRTCSLQQDLSIATLEWAAQELAKPSTASLADKYGNTIVASQCGEPCQILHREEGMEEVGGSKPLASRLRSREFGYSKTLGQRPRHRSMSKKIVGTMSRSIWPALLPESHCRCIGTHLEQGKGGRPSELLARP